MTIPEYRKELDAHHDRLKESKDYDTKLEALRNIAYHTALYLSEVYREEGLYDYRRIEKLAEKARRITDENLESARRYYEIGQVWRANIGLTSVALDFFIVQSGIEQIMWESGKHLEELGEEPGNENTANRLLGALRKTIKPLLGHNKRNPNFSIDAMVQQVHAKIESV